jgi:hypothetical protein
LTRSSPRGARRNERGQKVAVTQSRVARFVAAKEWPDVQTQRKYADGAYWFTCAGHGGTVVMLDRFAPFAQETLREHNLTAFVVVQTAGRRTKLYYSGEYERESLLRFAVSNGYEVVWVAVGEEDCGYADLFLAKDALRVGMNAKTGSTQTCEEVADTVKNWHPGFYTALTGDTLIADESYLLRKQEFDADNADNYVVTSACGDWHEQVPEGYVGVTAVRRSDGDKAEFLVSDAEYAARDGSFVVDEARHEKWERGGVA